MDNFDKVISEYATKIVEPNGLIKYELKKTIRHITIQVGNEKAIPSKKIAVTPFGEFASIAEAAKGVQIATNTMYMRFRNHPDLYYFRPNAVYLR